MIMILHELVNYICTELQSHLGDHLSFIDENVIISFIYKNTYCEISDDYEGYYFSIIFL